VNSEITGFRSLDKTTPAIKAAVGDKETETVCVQKAAAEPPPSLFAGSGYQCSYRSAYIKEGTLNATLDCRRGDLQGSVMMTVQGSYTASGFTGTADGTAYLPGPGDFAISRKLSGTVKPGACTPAPADDDDDDTKNG
jgi:hypothetical protein